MSTSPEWMTENNGGNRTKDGAQANSRTADLSTNFYHCGLCTFVTPDFEVYRTHTCRSGAPLFKCPYCNYSGTTSARLKQHMRSHTGERPFACRFCPYTTAYSNNLTYHTRKHTGERPFACTLCGFRSAQKSNLNTHMTKKHKVMKSSWSGTTQHRKSGLPGKQHKCSFCNYTTNKTTNLMRHVHTHTGEKPYACPLCPFRATQENNIKSHVRTHTGEKPYVCHLCPYRSSQKSNLNSHMLTHQPRNTF
ncbi:hypothetical protein SK128_023851 [Halocaridina rubra]|uniref:C2H2-type domain-containing protein n=1 Tax=Halocaridina rubra TaxID=373956 RepID=A0AAN8XNV6_HALRR